MRLFPNAQSLLPICLDTDHTQYGLELIHGFQQKTLQHKRIQVWYILSQFIQIVRKIGSGDISELKEQTPQSLWASERSNLFLSHVQIVRTHLTL